MPEFARVPHMFVSIFHPASPQATHLLWLWNVCMIVCGFILAVVTVAIVYILIRYRRRDDREPVQTQGNTPLEIVWTAVPILLVSLLVCREHLDGAGDRPSRANASPISWCAGTSGGGKWSIPVAGLTTANEIHVPVGGDMLIAVETADVIHDFWVPELGRKMDAIPGRRNFVWIRAAAPGITQGRARSSAGPNTRGCASASSPGTGGISIRGRRDRLGPR